MESELIKLKRELDQEQWKYANAASAEQANMANKNMMLITSKINKIKLAGE